MAPKTSHRIEPNEHQVCEARAARDAVKKCGWSYSFFPNEEYGARIEIKDPGNKGRLAPAVRAKWNQWRPIIEILCERGYALQKLKQKQGNAYVDTDASRLAARAMELFPGGRICFA